MRIGLRGGPFNETQVRRLEDTAMVYGSTLVRLDGEKCDHTTLTSFDALIGYFSLDHVADLPRLKWVQLPCAGVELAAGALVEAGRTDVTLTNCSGAFGADIAEHVVMVTLALLRGLPDYVGRQTAHAWEKGRPARVLRNLEVCVVGTGDIGRHVARDLRGIGVSRVTGVATHPRSVPGFDEVVGTSGLADAMACADLVVCCLPLTPATSGIVDAEAIGRMRPGALLVNVGRGGTVDLSAVTEALREGRLAGAALDVLPREPVDPDDPIWDVPNLLLTPHVSGWDFDDLPRQAIYSVCSNNLGMFCQGRPLSHVVDVRRGY